ncbi:MAG: hypothetical protein ABIS27_08375 [Longimicrobiales bacterium]
MKRTNVAPILLVACALAATACDNTPMQVVEPSLSPSFSAVTSAEKRMSFNENFDLKGSSARLLENTGAPPTYSNGGLIFPGSDRGYLRTIASNYNNTSFKADITMTIVGGFPGTGTAIAFFGFGTGEPDYGFFGEPTTDPSIYARVMPDEFNGPSVQITNATGGVLQEGAAEAPGQGGNGTHRLRISWDRETKEFTVFVHTNYVEGTAFVPTAVLGPIAVPGVFDDTNSRIYFGGAGNVTFDNLHVVAFSRKP